MAIKITITVEEVEYADEIQSMLEEAQEYGVIDFPFEFKQEAVDD